MSNEKQKHTPEPWRLHPEYKKTITSGDGSYNIANTSMNAAPHLQYANAERIVACVNALAGIEDPQAYIAECHQAKRDVISLQVDKHKLEEAVAALKADKEQLIALVKTLRPTCYTCKYGKPCTCGANDENIKINTVLLSCGETL